MAEWVGRPATEIANAVRSGVVTAAEVAAQHLDRIAKLNAELGAFVRVRQADAAREAAEVDARADRASLRLAGVPVAIKDTIPVAGVQLVAAPGGESVLLALAARLESAGGWPRHAPAYE